MELSMKISNTKSEKQNIYRKMLKDIVQENPFDTENYFHTPFPPQVVVETTNACNLNCLYCGRSYMDRLKGNMTRSIFGKIVSEIALVSPLTDILPTFIGEALMFGDELFNRLSLARRLGCRKIVLNTNGVLVEKFIDQILEGNIDRIIISCDAHTQETYQKIRRGKGEDILKKVYNGIHALKEAQEKLCINRPFIEVAFTVFEENEHEVDSFVEYWQRHGVITKIHPKGFHAGVIPGGEYRISTESDRIPCGWGRDTAVILWNGNVVLCPCDANARFLAGNIETQSISEIWNGPLKWIRELHFRRRFKELPEVCRKCPDWLSRSSEIFFPNESCKREYLEFVRMGKSVIHQSAKGIEAPSLD